MKTTSYEKTYYLGDEPLEFLEPAPRGQAWFRKPNGLEIVFYVSGLSLEPASATRRRQAARVRVDTTRGTDGAR